MQVFDMTNARPKLCHKIGTSKKNNLVRIPSQLPETFDI